MNTTTTNVIIVCDNKNKRHYSERATVHRNDTINGREETY